MITSSDGPITGTETQARSLYLSKLAPTASLPRGRFEHLTTGDVLRRLIDLHVTDNPKWRFPCR